MLVDSHCHLEFPDLAADSDGVLARAKAAGVGVCVTIGTKLATFPDTRAVAARYENVWCSVGVHPHEADVEPLEDAGPLLKLADDPKVVGIGETGLDFFYSHGSHEAQRINFRAHIDAARRSGLPLIVHTRDAEDDTIRILTDEMGKGPFAGVLHCFTGSQRLADAALELGFFISASGIITFKNSQPLRDVFRAVAMDRLLVETDAPYLAPVPHRGKRNEPAFVADTAAVLAQIKALTAAEIAAATTDNFFRLFTRVPRPVSMVSA